MPQAGGIRIMLDCSPKDLEEKEANKMLLSLGNKGGGVGL